MKYSIVVASIALVHSATAWPGMAAKMGDLNKRIAQAGNAAPPPGPLIGDLVTSITTPVGQSIANILLGTEEAQSDVAGYSPPPKESEDCKKDACCVWGHVSKALTDAFLFPNGECNDLARKAIRLGFHDAASWKQGMEIGGADGSIALNDVEIARPANNGLQGMVAVAKDLSKAYGVGMADFIQFAAAHAVVTCPLGPRMRTFVGRKDCDKAAPDGLLPDVNDSADNLLALFQDKTISAGELAALLGAHSTSQQFFVDPKAAGAPQDSTPGVWDVLFYNETTGAAPKEVFKFQSDVVLSGHASVKPAWNAFSGANGQNIWNEAYARSNTRLSLLGVNNINSLTECTKVLPPHRASFNGHGANL